MAIRGLIITLESVIGVLARPYLPSANAVAVKGSKVAFISVNERSYGPLELEHRRSLTR